MPLAAISSSANLAAILKTAKIFSPYTDRLKISILVFHQAMNAFLVKPITGSNSRYGGKYSLINHFDIVALSILAIARYESCIRRTGWNSHTR